MTWDQWIRTVEVEPSLYAADFSRLGEQIEQLLRAGARVFHFDVGDGHFVDPVTVGPIVLESIAPSSTPRARGSACSPAAPICGGVRDPCPSCSSGCSARPRSG